MCCCDIKTKCMPNIANKIKIKIILDYLCKVFWHIIIAVISTTSANLLRVVNLHSYKRKQNNIKSLGKTWSKVDVVKNNSVLVNETKYMQFNCHWNRFYKFLYFIIVQLLCSGVSCFVLTVNNQQPASGIQYFETGVYHNVQNIIYYMAGKVSWPPGHHVY